MKVKFTYCDIELEITYDEDGVFEYVTNLNTEKKMMIEIMQEGHGYTIKENQGYIHMDVCDARYVRIMELDLFIPRLLFIKNKTNMKAVLNFIINQELDLEDYPTLVEPMAKKFNIEEWLAKEIIDEVIKWENNTAMSDSLEKTLNKKFNLPFY